jgi:hypothetical protein
MNEQRAKYYREEYDLFHKPCEHEIIEDRFIHPEIGVEYYEVCKKCGETEFDN